MSYRTLHVGNKEYKYVIGRKFTKVRGVAIFDNTLIGSPHGGAFVGDAYVERYVVTPLNVRCALEGKPVPGVRSPCFGPSLATLLAALSVMG